MSPVTICNLSERYFAMPLIDEILIQILRCPQCHGDLIEDEAREGLRCDRCKLVYPVRDGIPIMMVDDARKLEDKVT